MKKLDIEYNNQTECSLRFTLKDLDTKSKEFALVNITPDGWEFPASFSSKPTGEIYTDFYTLQAVVVTDLQEKMRRSEKLKEWIELSRSYITIKH